MQYRPTAQELLESVTELLDGPLLAAVDGSLQHQVRVAANLLRIVGRELALGRAGDDAERERLDGVLGGSTPDADLATLRARLVELLDGDEALPPTQLAAIHAALLATARADLAICKPGYARWTIDR